MSKALQLHHKVNKLLRFISTVNKPSSSVSLEPSFEPESIETKHHFLRRKSHNHYWDNISHGWKKKKKVYKRYTEDDGFPPSDEDLLNGNRNC